MKDDADISFSEKFFTRLEERSARVESGEWGSGT